MKYHYMSIRSCQIKRLITPSAGEDMEQMELLRTAGGIVKFQALWKTVEQFLKKFNTHLLCDPAILLLGIRVGQKVHLFFFRMMVPSSA